MDVHLIQPQISIFYSYYNLHTTALCCETLCKGLFLVSSPYLVGLPSFRRLDGTQSSNFLEAMIIRYPVHVAVPGALYLWCLKFVVFLFGVLTSCEREALPVILISNGQQLGHPTRPSPEVHFHYLEPSGVFLSCL